MGISWIVQLLNPEYWDMMGIEWNIVRADFFNMWFLMGHMGATEKLEYTVYHYWTFRKPIFRQIHMVHVVGSSPKMTEFGWIMMQFSENDGNERYHKMLLVNRWRVA